MSRGRALRSGVAYDMRSGMKVKGRNLVSDGEHPGIWVEKGWADPRHPSRFVNVPPPDGLHYRPGPPATHAIGARVDLAFSMRSDTHATGTDTAQPYDVLRREPSKTQVAVYLDFDAIFIGSPDEIDLDLSFRAYWVPSLAL